MAYTPINWAENSGVTAVKLDQMDGQIDTNENDLRTIQGGTASVDGRITANEGQINNHEGRITNLEDYIVGNTTIFQSLSQFTTTSGNYVTAKEILVGKIGSARLTFEMRSNGVTVGFVYRILVDGLEVANGSHGGTTNWISYTEDISFQAGSNIKVQVASEFQDRVIHLQNFRFKIGNQSDMILEL